MSSSKTSSAAMKLLCMVYVISLVGSRSAVNGGVVVPGSLLSSNRPSSLVSAATSLYMGSKDGSISPSDAHKLGQNLILANQQATNLALVNSIRGKK